MNSSIIINDKEYVLPLPYNSVPMWIKKEGRNLISSDKEANTQILYRIADYSGFQIKTSIDLICEGKSILSRTGHGYVDPNALYYETIL